MRLPKRDQNPARPSGLSSLGLQIKDHWKRFRPAMYRGLQKAGDLDRSVLQAQNQTADALASLLQKGLQENLAWEAVRQEWAFLPSEREEPNLPRGRQPGVPRSPTLAPAPSPTTPPPPAATTASPTPTGLERAVPRRSTGPTSPPSGF